MKKYFVQTVGIPTVNGRVYKKENVIDVITKYFDSNDCLPVFNADNYYVDLLGNNVVVGKVYPDMIKIEDDNISVYLPDDIMLNTNIQPIIQWSGTLDGIYVNVEKIHSINLLLTSKLKFN